MHHTPLTALLLSLSCCAAALGARDHRSGGGAGGPDERARITFYEHSDFRGGSITLEPGQVLENLTRERFSNGQGMNDRISSIRIEGNAEVRVFHDAGLRGGSRTFDHSVANLNDSAPGWNDAISALRVELAPGGHSRGPDRPDFSRVDQMIHRAYRDVLGREADDGGVRVYRRHLLEDRWTEAQLRHSLRESDEFRQRADRIITKAYRELLDRDPSERERRTHRQRMVRDGWGDGEVRQAIRRTDEFRMRSRPPRGG